MRSFMTPQTNVEKLLLPITRESLSSLPSTPTNDATSTSAHSSERSIEYIQHIVASTPDECDRIVTQMASPCIHQHSPLSSSVGSCSSASSQMRDLEKENSHLKEVIKSLQAEIKIVVDHSVQSDQRLLQYTSQVFTNPLTCCGINQETQTECKQPSAHGQQTTTTGVCNNVNINRHTSTDESLSIGLSVLENQWITDDIISLYFKLLTSAVLRHDQTVLLMDTAVTHAVKCLHDCDHLLEPLQLSEKTHIFFPVHDLKQEINASDPEDSDNLYKKEGTHWSLLVYVRSLQTFLYLDSVEGYNLNHAKQIVKKVQKYLPGGMETNVEPVAVPQQSNSVDCGVYLTVFTDILLQLMLTDTMNQLGTIGSELLCEVTHADIITKRAQLALLWHNYRYQPPKPELISEMMFKRFQSSSAKPNTTFNTLRNSKINLPLDPTDCNQLRNDQWQNVKSTRKSSNYYTQREFNIITSNRFNPLSESNLDRQTSRPMTNKTEMSKTNMTSPSRKTRKPYNMLNSQIRKEDKKIKLDLYADSQGRGLPEMIGSCSKGLVYVDALVKSGADINYVYNQATKTQQRPLVLVAGTNDMLKRSPKDIYLNIENKLKSFSKLKSVLITTIPPRHDVQQNDAIHFDIALANNYIRELVLRIHNVKLIDFDQFKRYHFTHHGLHLNYRGKRKLAYMIVDYAKGMNECVLDMEACDNDVKYMKDMTPGDLNHSTKGTSINVIDDDMENIIVLNRNNKSVAFAHSISADCQMSAGVAVVFKRQFGRPKMSQRLTGHLALQNSNKGASVYSLITKARYFDKPDVLRGNYDTAFRDLTEDFKSKKLKHLICSPIGCLRDQIPLSTFVTQIIQFQQCTNAEVTIISYKEKSQRILLRRGLTHDDFLLQLRDQICQQSAKETPCNEDQDLKDSVLADTLTDADVGSFAATSTQVTVMESRQPSMQTSSQCVKVCVVPGDLTYCEALKQSKGDSVIVSDELYSSISCHSKDFSPVSTPLIESTYLERHVMDTNFSQCYENQKETPQVLLGECQKDFLGRFLRGKSPP